MEHSRICRHGEWSMFAKKMIPRAVARRVSHRAWDPSRPSP